MAGEINQEWLDRNAHRAFPFEENSDFSCEDGSALPLGLVLDARVCWLGDGDVGDVTLDSAVVSNGVAGIGMSVGGRPLEMLWGRGGSFAVTRGDLSVRITLCARDRLAGMAGSYRLSRPARLLPCRVLSIPYGVGVDRIRCGGVEASGVVRVSDGHNTELDISGNSLRLSIGLGLGKGRICDGGAADTCNGSPLYSLNGQAADSDGSIWITGGDGVAVSTGTYRGIPAVFVSTSAKIDEFMYR